MGRLVRTRRALALASALVVAGGALACNAIIGTRDLSYDPNATEGDGSPNGSDGSSGGTKDGGNGTQDGSSGQDGSMGSCPGVDILTSPANCGACGHDCTGGKCAAGICTLSEGAQAGLDGLEVSGANVFSAANDGTIGRCATNGCIMSGLTFVVSSSDLEPNRLRISAGGIFFSNYYDNATFPSGVYVVSPTVDAGVTRLTPTGINNVDELNVVVDAGMLFFSADTDPGKGFYRCTLGNCDAGTSLESAVQGYDSTFLPNGAFVWSTDTGIHYCASPPSCGTNTVIFDGDKGNGGWVSALAYDAQTDALYFTTAHYLPDKFPDKLQSCPAKNAACTPTTYVGGLHIPRGVAAGGGVVYWTEAGQITDGGAASDGTVSKCVVQAGACAGGVKVIAKGQKSSNRITLDAKSVYWTNEGQLNNFGTSGSIMKAPR